MFSTNRDGRGPSLTLPFTRPCAERPRRIQLHHVGACRSGKGYAPSVEPESTYTRRPSAVPAEARHPCRRSPSLRPMTTIPSAESLCCVKPFPQTLHLLCVACLDVIRRCAPTRMAPCPNSWRLCQRPTALHCQKDSVATPRCSAPRRLLLPSPPFGKKPVLRDKHIVLVFCHRLVQGA